MYLTLFLRLYKSFWKGFESDQRRLTNAFACLGCRKQDAQVSSHVTNIVQHVNRPLVEQGTNFPFLAIFFPKQRACSRANIVMLTINSRSPWEIISGFKLTVTSRQLICSLHSKRFQSSYCAKVRAEAKKGHSFCSCPSFLAGLSRRASQGNACNAGQLI